MGGHREGMSQTWEVSWPAERLREGLEKNLVYFVQRSELLAGLGEHRREGEMEAAKSTLHRTNTQDLEEREVLHGHECCWLGWLWEMHPKVGGRKSPKT